SCGFPCACCRPLLRAARRRPRLSCVRLNRRSLGAERPCLTSSYLHFSRDAENADSPMRARSNSSRYQSASQVILANGLVTPSHHDLCSKAARSVPLSSVRCAPQGHVFLATTDGVPLRQPVLKTVLETKLRGF